jgi:hypothetical protein
VQSTKGQVGMLKQGNQVMTEILGLREAMHKDNETTQRQLTDMRTENRKMRSENVQVPPANHHASGV